MRIIQTLTLVLFAALCLACGAVQQKMQGAADRVAYMNDMKQLGIAIANFELLNQRTPKDLNELQAKNPVSAEIANRILTGEISVVWGIKLKDQLNGTSQTLMAWSQNPPVAPGQVIGLFCDGEVKLLTPEEFAVTAQASASATTDSKKNTKTDKNKTK